MKALSQNRSTVAVGLSLQTVELYQTA